MTDLFKFKLVSISKEDTSKDLCDLCKSNRGFLGYFDTCNHSCCSKCIDNLYDTYDVINTETYYDELFKCPTCFKKILNVEYK